MKTMTDYSNILEDIIFPSFVRSCIPDINLKELEKECYHIQERESSVKVSNSGGYHSPVRKNMEHCENYKHFNKLIQTVRTFSQDTTDYYQLNIKFSELYWWFNINKAYHYNLLHTHRRADLIGVFYIRTPKDCGELSLMRKDGSEYSNLYASRLDMLQTKINAEAGRLYLFPGHLWHYVSANESTEDRISVSFNIHF